MPDPDPAARAVKLDLAARRHRGPPTLLDIDDEVEGEPRAAAASAGPAGSVGPVPTKSRGGRGMASPGQAVISSGARQVENSSSWVPAVLEHQRCVLGPRRRST